MPDIDNNQKIFCANCFHCKVVRSRNPESPEVVMKVRCVAGMWKKRVGNDKLYRLDTVEQRRVPECPHYDPMGDSQEFIRELKRTLPQTQELVKSESS